MLTLTIGTTYSANGIGQQFTNVTTGGPIMLGLLAAALASLVSFASLCVILLVSGRVSYLTGTFEASGVQSNGVTTRVVDATSVDEHDGDGGYGQRSSTARVGLATLLLVLGFTVIFVLGSASIFGPVSTLRLQACTLTIIGGVMTIVMGLAFVGMMPALQRDTRMAPKRWTTQLGAPLLDAAFALGRASCLGPTLTAIISVSVGTQGMTAARGVALITAYCLGPGLLFVLVALGSTRAARGVGFLRKYSRTTQIIGDVAPALMGITLVTGLWGVFVVWVQAVPVIDMVTPI